MNHEQPKGPRKLQMLPEVLPAPSPGEPTTDARGRTVAHMRRMLATATATATAITATGACSREAGPSSTVTIPTATATSASTATAPLPPLHSATTVATATPVTTASPDVGYAVVDPMPAPARCMGLAPASKALVTLKHDGANGIVAEVSLTLATTGSWAGSAFDRSNPPSAWGGQLVGTSFKGATAVARIKPTLAAGAQSGSVGVSFPISCAAGNGNLSVTAAIPLPLRDGAKATSVSLADY